MSVSAYASDTTAPAISAGGRVGCYTPAILWIFPTLSRSTLVEGDVTVLGRGESCTVILPGMGVSRVHAEIVRLGPVHVLRDRGSKNGLYVDGRRVAEAPLSKGTLIRIGDWLGIVQLADTSQPCLLSLQRLSDGLFGGNGLINVLAPAIAAAASDMPIIVEGDTGTGKERVARAIHAWSKRKGPFIAVNCAAIPESLAEAELFGVRKGAFTGADRSTFGYLRAAHEGTLLLDEVTDLPLSIQSKLLRTLQEREVVPVGDSCPISVDARLIVASQIPMSSAVRNGSFRADLWARMNGLEIRLPPLRERVEDIPSLFSTMLENCGLTGRRLKIELVERLCLHSWPLNLREMVALAKRVSVFHCNEKVLGVEHLANFVPAPPVATAPAGARITGPRFQRAYPPEQVQAFVRVLEQHDNNMTKAASALGITRTKAYRLLSVARLHDKVGSEGPPSRKR